jgi:hypothetical protein
MESRTQKLFEDFELQIQRLDNGMTFHQETCELCTDQSSCDIWTGLVEEWNLYFLLERKYGKKTQNTA